MGRCDVNHNRIACTVAGRTKKIAGRKRQPTLTSCHHNVQKLSSTYEAICFGYSDKTILNNLARRTNLALYFPLLLLFPSLSISLSTIPISAANRCACEAVIFFLFCTLYQILKMIGDCSDAFRLLFHFDDNISRIAYQLWISPCAIKIHYMTFTKQIFNAHKPLKSHCTKTNLKWRTYLCTFIHIALLLFATSSHSLQFRRHRALLSCHRFHSSDIYISRHFAIV